MSTRPDGSDDAGQSLNGDFDEDAALAQAIALSLQQDAASPTGAAPDAPIVIDETRHVPIHASSSGSMNSLQMDRKQMEEDRLARQRKRTAEASGLEDAPPRPSPQLRAAVAQKRSNINTIHSINTSTNAGTSGGSGSGSGPDTHSGNTTDGKRNLRFLEGMVKRTHVSGVSRTQDDITIDEILDKGNLELAVLSSFQFDADWLISKIDIRRTKLLFVAYATDENEKQAIRQGVTSGRVRFCFPPINGLGFQHSKLQLLKFQRHLRIVVPTGNLVPYDWGETGVLENMVFLIDLPLLEAGNGKGTTLTGASATAANSRTAFGIELRRFLQAQGVDESLVSSLDKYDFSATERYRFVHSIAGAHQDPSWQDTGYCGLGKAVSSLGLGTNDPVKVDYVTSSLGSLNHPYLKTLYYACQGDSGMKEFQERQGHAGKKGRAKSGSSSQVGAQRQNDTSILAGRFQIYFPTEKTVMESRGGRGAAGTICFQTKWWSSPDFPREAMRDAVSTKRGVLMHHKLIFVQSETSRDRGDRGRAWAYVGSANLSESAWGKLVKDRATGKAKLNCRNWECGVLVPAEKAQAVSSVSGPVDEKSRIRSDLGAFGGRIPVPIDTAVAHAYGSGASLDDGSKASRPWFFR